MPLCLQKSLWSHHLTISDFSPQSSTCLWTSNKLFSNDPRFLFQWFPTNFFPNQYLLWWDGCEISIVESEVPPFCPALWAARWDFLIFALLCCGSPSLVFPHKGSITIGLVYFRSKGDGTTRDRVVPFSQGLLRTIKGDHFKCVFRELTYLLGHKWQQRAAFKEEEEQALGGAVGLKWPDKGFLEKFLRLEFPGL